VCIRDPSQERLPQLTLTPLICLSAKSNEGHRAFWDIKCGALPSRGPLRHQKRCGNLATGQDTGALVPVFYSRLGWLMEPRACVCSCGPL